MKMTKDGAYMEVEGEVSISAFKNSGWAFADSFPKPEAKAEEPVENEPNESVEEAPKKAKRTKK